MVLVVTGKSIKVQNPKLVIPFMSYRTKFSEHHLELVVLTKRQNKVKLNS